MSSISVLDCTLRDGGYCNNWTFGRDNIKKIAGALLDSNIDIIEMGYISKRAVYDSDRTIFRSINEISSVIPVDRNGKLFVGMINYGEFPIEELPEFDGTSVEGIRIAFHKNCWKEAIEYSRKVKEKGYKVFIQGMVSLSYEDREFIDLIQAVNRVRPYAFYIVDSFGMMKNKEVVRLFYTVEHVLDEDIIIGFHSHNNMQLAYSNSLSIAQVQSSRKVILDSSIYGMGRGAGNLNTELIIEYLNQNEGTKYQIRPLLIIIDEIIDEFYQENKWGYSLPNYISAAHSAHPNYAKFLNDKKTLTVEDMDKIFLMMDREKKSTYDKQYIEEVYLSYLNSGKVQEQRHDELLEKLKGKTVLLIAPGKNATVEKDKIIQKMKQDKIVSVSINFDFGETDYVFISNLRRFREIEDKSIYKKCIITSNIVCNNVYLQTQYSDLLCDIDTVRENAGLMAIRFFKKYKVKEILLAGYDGYSYDKKENYANNQLAFITQNAILDAMNEGMCEAISIYSKEIDISFLTKTRYTES